LFLHAEFYSHFISITDHFTSEVIQLQQVLMAAIARRLQFVFSYVGSPVPHCGIIIAFLLAIVFTPPVASADIDCSYTNSIKTAMLPELNCASFVSLVNLIFPKNSHLHSGSLDYFFDNVSGRFKVSSITNRKSAWLRGGFLVISNASKSSSVTVWLGHDIKRWMATWHSGIGSNAVSPVPYIRYNFLPRFYAAYRSVLGMLVTLARRTQRYLVPMGATIVGIASTYNPFRDKIGSDEKQTASGEPYDPAAWTAAIQIDLRDRFGGVHYGKNYQPTYALVECGKKRIIVKINDVGPLKPGRVIDLNERSMRYFDPSLQLGLIRDVKITPLRGIGWMPGPIGDEHFISVAAAK
jgi:rare lipoprotein A